MAEAAQVEVRGGETTVIELDATPSQSSANLGAANERGLGTGSLEVQLLDEQGNPITKKQILYLRDSNGKYLEMKIDETGFGSLDQVPVGDYELTLQKPAANPRKAEQLLGQLKFDSSQTKLPTSAPVQRSLGSTQLPADALVTIRKIVATTESLYNDSKGIYRLTAHGYADNVPDTTTRTDYALERAKSAKDALEQERSQRKLSWLEVAMESHGVQPGDTEAERAQNRRVEIILRPPQPAQPT